MSSFNSIAVKKTFAKLSWNLSWRQLRGNSNFTLSMVFNIALGLTGYLTVESFNRSFLAEISLKTKQIAGADLVISSRQDFSEEQKKLIAKSIPETATLSEEISLTTMATSLSQTRLVDIRFVDDLFPLYPGIELQNLGKIFGSAAKSLNHNQIWVYRELLSQLNVKVGDSIKIGESHFEIVDVVVDDPSTGSGVFAFSPRVFARLDDRDQSKLINVGSRAFYVQRFKISGAVNIEQISEQLKLELKKLSPGIDIRVRTHKAVTEDISKIQGYLNDYLSLIALTSLFLSAIGAAYLMRGHLDGNIKEFAILSSLGANRYLPSCVFVLQCVLLGVAAAIIALIFSAVAMPTLAKAMAPLIGQVEIQLLSPGLILLAASFSILMGILLTFPQLLKLNQLNPSFLFQESAQPTGATKFQEFLAYGPAFFVWWGTSVFQAKSFYNGTVFAGACVLAALLLALMAIPLTKLATKLADYSLLNWRLSLALRNLSRNKTASISSFLALAIGSSLIVLVPQLRNSISFEISRPHSAIPQLFMFDIQDDQLEEIQKYFVEKKAKLGLAHPMIRARLEKINSEPIELRKMDLEGEKEQQQRENLQNRTQNLSYRTELSNAETLIKGAFPKNKFLGEGVPELSVEEGFAKRLKLNLNDELSFDISGVPFSGRITSIRKVRWTSFEPNFMILVQPGALDDAPKIWVTSVSQIAPGELNSSQTHLTNLYANVSVIDIKDTVKRLLTFVDQISVAVNVVAWLSLLGGAGVLYSIAYASSLRRYKSLAILKTLGATAKDAQATILLEYAMISLCAIFFGVFLGVLATWLLSTQILKTQPDYQSLSGHYVALLILPLSLLLSYFATHKATRVSINSLLS